MDDRTPKVSIVLPTYNGSKYIRQSIDSCLNQTFKDFELIIIDDCSTDNTPQLIKSYSDPRIKYFRNETNQRLPRSLNIGFAKSKGQYLTWTSDDNFFTPDSIEKMIGALDAQKGDFVYCDFYSFQEGKVEEAKIVRLEDSGGLIKDNCVMGCFLYSRRVLETVGNYDDGMELVEDYDYWVRISQRFPLYHIKEPLYFYQYHSQSLTGKKSKEIDIIFYLFRFKYDFISFDYTVWIFRNMWLKKFEAYGPLGKCVGLLFYKVVHKKRVNIILKNLKQKKISFKEAKNSVYQFVYGGQSRL